MRQQGAHFNYSILFFFAQIILVCYWGFFEAIRNGNQLWSQFATGGLLLGGSVCYWRSREARLAAALVVLRLGGRRGWRHEWLPGWRGERASSKPKLQ